MRNHLISLCSFLVAMLLPLSSPAYSFMVDGLCYNKNTDGTSVTVTYQNSSAPRYSSLSGDLVIPSSVTHDGITYSVTTISLNAFYGCTDITSVIIPNTVTSIGSSAFYGCTSITEVAIGNSVTSIGDDAFSRCNGMTSVTIGNSVTSIGNSAFSHCSGLTSVTIPNTVTKISAYAFKSCSRLSSITLGNSVTNIGSEAFSYCTGLTSVVWNAKSCADFSSATSPFKDATNIKSFEFGIDVEKIPSYLCNGLSGLTEVHIPNTVVTIGDYAFYNCNGLSWVTIPNSVTSIGSSAFYGCTSITEVAIGNSVTSIGNSAFSGCTGIAEVTIGNSVTSIGSYAFSSCTSITSIVWNAKNCTDFSLTTCPFKDATNIKSFMIGDEVEKIPAYICYGLSKLSAVTIGNSVVTIGNYAFVHCSGLTSVVWNAKNCTDFSSSPFKDATNIKSFEFGVEVEKIPSYLCSGLSGLTEVHIPNSVVTIGDYAFSGCRGLISMAIPNSVTSIGSSVFNNCSGLTSVTIPNSVTSIGSSAFNNCSGLTSVTIPNSVTSIGSSVFNNCSGLTSVTIPNTVTSIGSSAFNNCSGLTSVTIPNSVTSIGSSAFSGCTGITSIVWNAKNCTDFSSTTHPFKDATNIKSFEFGNEVEQIPAFLCYGLSGLTAVDIPDSMTSIGNSAFYNCSGLTSVAIPESVVSIGTDAFSGCSGLTRVEISDLAKWCAIAFSSSSSNPLSNAHHLFLNGDEIFDLAIPDTANAINDYAFSGCTGLTSIKIPGSVNSVASSAFSDCNNIVAVDFDAPDYNLNLGSCSLTSLHFGNNVTTISAEITGTFDTVSIPASVTTISRGVFKNCKIQNVIIEDGDTELDNGFAYYSGDPPSIYYDFSGTTYNTFESCGTKYLYIGRPTKNFLVGYNSSGGSRTLTEIVLACNHQSMSMYYNCSALEKITFFKEITSLPTTSSTKGFSTQVLRDVYAYWADPPTIQESFFTTEAYANAILHVPAGAAQMYKLRMGWKNFSILEDLPTTPPQQAVKCTSLILNQHEISMTIGDEQKLSYELNPEEATNQELTWTSSNAEVATVSADGTVAALSIGTTTITVATTDGSELSDECMIVVNEPSVQEGKYVLYTEKQFIVGSAHQVVEIPINLKNHGDVSAFDIEYTFPGMSFSGNIADSHSFEFDENLYLELADRASDVHIAEGSSMLENEEGASIHLVLEGTLPAGDDKLFTLRMIPPKTGVYTMNCNNLNKLSLPNGTIVELPNQEFTIVAMPIAGDLNDDGVVDDNDRLGGNPLYGLSLSSANQVCGLINEDTDIPVCIITTSDVSDFSFTIALPENIEPVGDIETFALTKIEGIELTTTSNDDGSITIAGHCSTPMAAGDNNVMSLKVRTQWQKTYDIRLTNVSVTGVNGKVITLPDATTHLVMTGTRGDMNGDNRVDLSDALYILNMVTGQAE